MAFITRLQALEALRAQVAAGKPVVGCGAGTGISAKCAEAGGADLIIIYNSGRYRMARRWRVCRALPASSALPVWSVCPPNVRSPARSRRSKACR